MKITYYFNETVKDLIKGGVNTFIVDNVLQLGEAFVGANTEVLLEEYKIRVQRLKDFSKWILNDKMRYNIDTSSNNFTLLHSFFTHLYDSDMFQTHNLSFLRAFQLIIIDMITETKDNGGDTTHMYTILGYVDEEIRNIEDEQRVD